MTPCQKTLAFFTYPWRGSLWNYRFLQCAVCTGTHNLPSLPLVKLALTWSRKIHHAWRISFVLGEQIGCPFGTKPLWRCRHMDHPALSFQNPPLNKITVPPRTVKRYSTQSSWTHLEKPECQSLPIEYWVLAFRRYEDQNCLKLAQISLQFHTESLCPRYWQLLRVYFSKAVHSSHFLHSDCESSLVDGHCRWAPDLHLACCSLPCSWWPRKPSDISLVADARWMIKRFETDKFYAGIKTREFAVRWPRYHVKIVNLWVLQK